MFQILNDSLHLNQSDTFCFDCIYNHSYIITQCSHTICLTCIYEAIDENIRLRGKTFICPRCTDSQERRSRLGQSMIQTRRQERREIKKSMQVIKIEQDSSCDQQSKVIIALDEDFSSGSFWPVGTESWFIHEIKPPREIFALKTAQERVMAMKPVELGTETQPVNSLVYSSWPAGTESWHVHEIKPQRESFARKTVQEKLMTMQPAEPVDETQPVEDLLEPDVTNRCGETDLSTFQRNDKRCQPVVPKTANTPVLRNPAPLINVAVSVDGRQRQCVPTSKSTNEERKLKLQHNCNKRDRKPAVQDVSSTSRIMSQNSSLHHLLGSVGTGAVQCLQLILSVLLRIAIVYHLANSSNDSSSDPSSKTDRNRTTFTITIPCTNKHFTSLTYTRTIEILRDLESLILYAII